MRVSLQKRPVHGLLDGVSMALRLNEWHEKAQQALHGLGLGNTDLPDSPLPFMDLVADHLGRKAIASFGSLFDSTEGARFKRILAFPVSLMGRWWFYLAPLDRMGKLSPVLWVRREALPKSRRPSWLADTQAITLLEICRAHSERWEAQSPPTRQGSLSITDVLWCPVILLELNQWWAWDLERARRFLGTLSKTDLQSELARGDRLEVVS